jgi:YD repeat-containing protein
MSKANPKKIDYNKDTVVDQNDDALANQDLNKDGKVTDKEKTQYQRKQGSSTTKYTYDAEGNITSQKTTSGAKTTEPTMTAEGYGFNKQFLDANPDVREAIRLATENQWTQEVLNRYIENNTEFGKRTTDTQAAFDINIAGEKSEDLNNQIKQRTDSLKRQVQISGVTISDEEIQKFARESVRSGLTDNDALAFIAERFKVPSAEEAKKTPVTGQAGNILDEIRGLARSYGVTVTDADLQKKAREAMSMGGDWRTWLDGQRDVFRNQAKTLYPTVANLLDTSDLATIMNPYMSDASELLGVDMAQMQVTDPLWQSALNGPNGPLSRDEWIRSVRTDSRFGYDRTVRARQEYTTLADELLSAFGMA